ncbi:tryptophan--tRNA ligase [Allorhizocola rhizosphaerae]|uniref:tryptophan--tRNA ligase n=1 Tax=Allorhizocola rhizosphaerae TaxID=1872709 RepID=UPI000E3E879A|nr:tryptophan--tRNA ligase [Allorhizocola rhizosphaerae]
MTRRLTGLKPTGHLQLGNLLGAIRPLVGGQRETGSELLTAAPSPAVQGTGRGVTESVIMIVDLHALTIEHDPQRVRDLTVEHARLMLAAGVDPDVTTMYVQSHLSEHAQLHYLLECATGFGEARRMIQFKEKSTGPDPVRLSLLTYPVLMAADILLHDTEEVPVGDDQTQHLELARDVAYRFNTRYGQTFTVPRAVTPAFAARIMDLAEPTAKMGKTNAVTAGVIGLLDRPDVVRRKVMRAVTDTRNIVRRDPDRQPGVTNLLEIYVACTGDRREFASYGELKTAVADAVIAVLEPIQRRFAALTPGEVLSVLHDGAKQARPRAQATLERATEAIGLIKAA